MATGAAEDGRKVPQAPPRPKIRLSPVGFWSYSRRDDELSRGRLSQLRSLLLAELQTQYGRDGIQLFQDVSAIPHGADWERITTGAIDESTFFIPIVTPFYMQSRWCARETKMFEARESAIFEAHPDLSRDRRRIFPLLWINVKDVEALDEEAAAALKVAQWCDFSRLRHRNLEHDEEVLANVAAFAKSIVDVLQLRVEAPLSPEEQAQLTREAQKAGRLAEEEQQRREREAREAERQRAFEAERRDAERERQRLEDEAEQRLAAEQRERREVVNREAALRVKAERRQREAEREVERQAARDANLALPASALRSRTFWLALGAALVALLLLVSLPRLFRGGERRGTIDTAPASAPSPAIPANDLAAPSVGRAPELRMDWLLGRWCVGGNRANIQTISRDGDNIVIAFSGQRQMERITDSTPNTVTTDVASYTHRGNAVEVREPGYTFRLEACR